MVVVSPEVVLTWYGFCFRECRFLTFLTFWIAFRVEINTEEFE